MTTDIDSVTNIHASTPEVVGGGGGGKIGGGERVGGGQGVGQLDNPNQTALLVLTEHSAGAVMLKTEGVIPGHGPPPEVPTFCCMAGCPSCVWVVFAAEMTEYYKDGGSRARVAIEALEDQTVKSFLLMELEDVLSKQ